MRLHHWQRDLCDRLEGVYRWAAEPRMRRIVRVVLIDAPPQSGKSEVVSRRGPVWAMAELGLSVASVSYGASLAVEHSDAARRIMRSGHARSIWPHIDDRSRRQRQAPQDREHSRQDDWTLPARDPTQPGPRYIARGRDGALTGRAVDVITLDDMYKDLGDYESLASRREVDQFLRSSALARLMERGGLLVDMGTRWGTRDTKAWWAERATELADAGLDVQIEHWSYPLRAIEGDLMGRQPGDYITENWTPEKEAAARIFYGAAHRAILDCDPEDPMGGLYQRDVHLCHRYAMPPSVAASMCSATYLAVDAAETAGGGDYTVIQWWGVREAKAYLLRQWREQVDDLGVVRLLGEAIDEAGPHGILVEDTSAGKVALAALRGQIAGLVPVSASGQGSKRDRIKGTLLLWAQGDVLLPERHGSETSWLYRRDRDQLDLVDRLAALRGERPDMRGEVDDEADAATIFLRWWLQRDDAAPIDASTWGQVAAGLGAW